MKHFKRNYELLIYERDILIEKLTTSADYNYDALTCFVTFYAKVREERILARLTDLDYVIVEQSDVTQFVIKF